MHRKAKMQYVYRLFLLNIRQPTDLFRSELSMCLYLSIKEYGYAKLLTLTIKSQANPKYIGQHILSAC